METRTLIRATAPVWADETYTCILLKAEFLELPHLKEMPFVAHESDFESYGREIFQRARDGEFGEIAPFASLLPQPLPPPPKMHEDRR